jgi:ATP-dependent Clp protease, protease subunit
MGEDLSATQYRWLLKQHEERLKRGEIWINFPIDSDSVELVVMQLLKANEATYEGPVRVFINSPGGNVEEGQAVIDTMLTLPRPVWTINIGSAYSMGLSIFLAGDRRFAYPSAAFMAHDASYGTGDEKLAEHEAFTKFAKQMRSRDADFFASRTAMSRKWWLNKFKQADYWFDSAEAMKLGVVTDIVTQENFRLVFPLTGLSNE